VPGKFFWYEPCHVWLNILRLALPPSSKRPVKRYGC
jgi:hypothetical protein